MKRALALGMAAVMVAGLAACGGSGSSSTPASGSTSSAGSTTATGTGALNTDTTTLYIYMASEPDSLDPALNSTADGGCLANNSFVGLYTYDENADIVPALATETEISEDGLTYTFTVPETKWSDGTPLTAADFEYSWKRAAKAETGASYGYLFAMFEGYDGGEGEINVTAEGDKLICKLASPCPYFLELMAFPTFMPVPQASVEAADPDGTNPKAWVSEAGFVSNGAYTCTEWKHNESMTYTKNPNFYRADEVKIEKLQIMLSSDDTATFAAYNAGNLDFIDTIPNAQLGELLANEDPELYVADNIGTYYVGFNVNSELFAGKTPEQANDMRHAINLLIDRQYIVDTIGQTGQHLANTFIPDSMSDGNGNLFKQNTDSYTFPDAEAVGYYDPSQDAYEDNLAEAIELLKSAGFEFDENNMLSADTPLQFTYLTNEGEGNEAIGAAIQQDLAVIGAQVDIATEAWSVFLNDRKAGNYDVARQGWLADFDDPINMLEMWTSGSGNNDSQFGRPAGSTEPGPAPSYAPQNWTEYDNLIAQIKSETDLTARVAEMHKAEDMLMETYALVPLYYYNDPYMQKSNVTGVYTNPFGYKYFMFASKTAA